MSRRGLIQATAAAVSLLFPAWPERAAGTLRTGSDSTKPRCTIAVIGHVDHGKTTLTAAITKVLAGDRSARFVPYDVLDDAPETSVRGLRLRLAQVEYETGKRRYLQTDCPSHADHVKNMIGGPSQIDGAILVVSAADGPMPQTREHILLARRVGVPALVVYMNKVDIDMNDAPELLGLVELEVRELLSAYKFPGDDIPIVWGSALAALEDRDPEIGEKSVRALLAEVDSHIPTPERPRHQPFLMPIEDVFSISGRGTVSAGRIERGTVRVGDEIEIVGLRDTRKTHVTAVEFVTMQSDHAETAPTIGVLLQGIDREGIERGQVLCKPGSITPHAKFKAEAYILIKEEGGRHTPFFTDYRPQFFFHAIDVTGTARLPEGTNMVMPGDNVELTVELIAPIAVEPRLRFAIREGGRIVGVGVVISVIE